MLRKMLCSFVVVASLGIVGVPHATPAAAAVSCEADAVAWWSGFYSASNGKWVTAEISSLGSAKDELRARASSQGPWEKFVFKATSDGHVAIQSRANNRYVAAELGNTGSSYALLRARATSIGPWEKFDLYTQANGTCAIRSVANGRYVTAELASGDRGQLRARATSVGEWERFTTPAPPTYNRPVSANAGYLYPGLSGGDPTIPSPCYRIPGGLLCRPLRGVEEKGYARNYTVPYEHVEKSSSFVDPTGREIVSDTGNVYEGCSRFPFGEEYRCDYTARRDVRIYKSASGTSYALSKLGEFGSDLEGALECAFALVGTWGGTYPEGYAGIFDSCR